MILFFIISLSLKSYDTPNDGGGSITIEVLGVEKELKNGFVYRNSPEETEFEFLGILSRTLYKYIDDGVVNSKEYLYKVVLEFEDTTITLYTGPVSAKAQWYDKTRTSVLIFLIIFSGLVLWFIQLARKNPEGLFIRKIPALDAIDEAVGRSTEMGKPTFFIHGLSGITDAGTLAALTILRRVSSKVAEYDTPIIVTNYDPIVMAASSETVKQAYAEVGKIDNFNEKNIVYLTYEQFGYTAGVDGLMIRESPGAVFLQGFFYAESLILAETGHSVGAIQIAGTTAATQLPFFIAACDYVLIGEETLAASSYIGREPVMLGSVKGSDYGKMFIMIFIGIGVVFATITSILKLTGNTTLMNLFEQFMGWL